MKRRYLAALLVLSATSARAEKFDSLGSTLEHLAWLALVLFGGTVVVLGAGLYWLLARRRRKQRQALEREQAFYESL